MKVLLAGPRTEDARSTVWAHVVTSLRRRAEVFPFDPAAAESSGKDVVYQWRWLMATYEPDRIVLTADCREDLLAAADAASIPAVRLPDRPMVDSSLLGDSGTERRTLVVGDASDPAAQWIRSQESENFGILGAGWDRFPELWPFQRLEPFGGERASVLAAAEQVVVFPGKDSQIALLETLFAERALFVGSGVLAPTGSVYELLQPVSGPSIRRWEGIRRAIGPGDDSLLTYDIERFWDEQGIARTNPSIRTCERAPKFTVYTAAYNIERFIGPAIESVLDQTFTDFELLVCNDGSTDGSRQVIAKYGGDPRVRVLDQENIGQTGRFDLIWRSLLRLRRGDFVVSTGGDDTLRKDRLQRTAELLDEDPTVGIIHSAGTFMTEEGEKVGPTWDLPTSYDTTSLSRTLLGANVIAMPSTVMHHSLFDRYGELEDGFAADYSFWLKASRTERFRYLPETLVDYRVHAAGASTGQAERNGHLDHFRRLSAAARARAGIADLYPLLLSDGSEVDAAAAHVDLAYLFLRGVPQYEAAVEELRAAASLHPPLTAWVDENVRLMGNGQEAVDMDRIASLYRDPLVLSRVPFFASEDRARGLVAWDGSSPWLRKILCVVPWEAPYSVGELVRQYFACFGPEDEIELVIPTLGHRPHDALDALLPVLPTGVDFSRAARISIETIDDIALVPLSRYAAVLTAADTFGIEERFSQIRATLKEPVRVG